MSGEVMEDARKIKEAVRKRTQATEESVYRKLRPRRYPMSHRRAPREFF